MNVFRVLACIVCVSFLGNVYAETEPTKKDKEGLVGKYKFEGNFKKGRDLVVELTISLDDEGNLIGHQRYKHRKTKGEWFTSIFTNYRRLSRSEWIDEWKVKTLSGDRCGNDRHCFVANQAYTYKWNNEEYTKYGKRLHQFTLDYQEVQNYSVGKKGHAGGLSSPYFKVSDDKPSIASPSGTKTEPTPENDQKESPTNVKNIKLKLLELKGLLDDGLISKEDYNRKKTEFLDRM